MKKFFIFFVMVAICPSWVQGWGLLDDVFTEKPLIFEVVNQKGTVRIPVYARQKLKKERKIDDFGKVVSQRNVYGKIEDKQIEVSFKRDAQEALNRWFTVTRETIVKAGREKEFADLLAVFPDRIELYDSSYEDRSSTLLLLDYSPCEEGRNHRAGHQLTSQTSSLIQLTVPYDTGKCASSEKFSDPKEIILHEVGHAYALRDQYGLFGWYDKTQPIVFSSWVSRSGSSMAAGYKGIQPDDVDGFINVVDFVMAYKYGVVSERVKKGWQSFYDNTVYYSYMMPYRPKDPQQDLQVKAQHQTKWQQIVAVRNDFRKVGQYQTKIDAEMARLESQVKGKLVEGSKTRGELSEQELQNMLLLAQVNYWETIQRELNSSLGNTMEEIKDASTLEKLQTRLTQLIHKYNIPSMQVNQAQLNKTLTKDSIANSLVCAACERPIEHIEEAVTLQTKTKQGLREFFVHKDCAHTMKHNPKSKYLHQLNTVQEYTYLTYEQCKADLEALKSKPKIQQQLQEGLSAGNLDDVKKQNFLPTLSHSKPNGKSTADALTPDEPLANVLVLPAKQEKTDVATKKEPVVQAQKPRQPVVTGFQIGQDVFSAGQTVVPTQVSPTKSKNSLSAASMPKTASTSTPKGLAKPKMPMRAAVGQVEEGKTIVCEICGKPIETGNSFYKRTSSKAIHRHSACAYTYFTQKYAVDDKALNSYEKAYWWGLEPTQVTQAKGLLQDLGLSVADLRRLRSAQEHEQQKINQQTQSIRKQEQERLDSQAALDTNCWAAYVIVHEADVQRFEQENASILKAIRRKEMRGDTERSIKEQRVTQQYKQLKQNQAKTAYCQKLEDEAVSNGVSHTPALYKPVSKTVFLQRLAAFQQNAASKKLDGNGVVLGFYDLTDAYFSARNAQPYFITMQWYAYLTRVLASGSQNGTLVDYMSRVLRGKEGKNVPLEKYYSKAKLTKMIQDLQTDKKAFPTYQPLVAQVNAVRKPISQVEVDAAVAQAKIAVDRLTLPQQAQIKQMIRLITPLADELAKIQDTPVLAHVARGLQQEPLYAKNYQALSLGKFLSSYGRFASQQAEGVKLAKIGEKMIAVK